MNKLLTVWGEALDRGHPLPEYPRPQLVRSSYVNLNGVWRYAIAKGAERCAAYSDRPTRWDGEIVVPFAPESILSGVERQLRPNEALWYERPVTLPEGFVKDRVLLRFESTRSPTYTGTARMRRATRAATCRFQPT